jgi:hypothetical protein
MFRHKARKKIDCSYPPTPQLFLYEYVGFKEAASTVVAAPCRDIAMDIICFFTVNCLSIIYDLDGSHPQALSHFITRKVEETI